MVARQRCSHQQRHVCGPDGGDGDRCQANLHLDRVGSGDDLQFPGRLVPARHHDNGVFDDEICGGRATPQGKRTDDEPPHQGIMPPAIAKEISYRFYMKLKGKGLDVTFSPTGAVEVVEKEIEAKDLPKQIMATIEKKYPNPKFSKVEEISKAKDGKMVLDIYEILFTTAAKKTIEMTFAPDGKLTGEVDKTGAKKAGESEKSKT